LCGFATYHRIVLKMRPVISLHHDDLLILMSKRCLKSW